MTTLHSKVRLSIANIDGLFFLEFATVKTVSLFLTHVDETKKLTFLLISRSGSFDTTLRSSTSIVNADFSFVVPPTISIYVSPSGTCIGCIRFSFSERVAISHYASWYKVFDGSWLNNSDTSIHCRAYGYCGPPITKTFPLV